MYKYIKSSINYATNKEEFPISKDQLADIFNEILNINECNASDIEGPWVEGDSLGCSYYSSAIVYLENLELIKSSREKLRHILYEYSPSLSFNITRDDPGTYIAVWIPFLKKNTWKYLSHTLNKEAEYGIDSLYELTEVGEKLESIQHEVEDKMGIWLEASIQSGIGGVWFYSKKDDSILASNYDYQTFNEDTIDMAINATNKTEFKKAYKQYLKSILNDPEYAGR